MAISKKKLLEAFAVSELKDIAAHYDLKLKARSRKDWVLGLNKAKRWTLKPF